MKLFSFFVLNFLSYSLYSQTDFVVSDVLKKFNGNVAQVSIDSVNGVAYLGGSFTNYDGAPRGTDIIYSSTMQPGKQIPDISGISGAISDNQGGWFVGAQYVAGLDESLSSGFVFMHIFADGTVVYMPPNPLLTTYPFGISQMTLYGDDNIICWANGYIRIFDFSTGQTVFSMVCGTAVNNLVIQGDVLYGVGSFSTVGGQSRPDIFAIDLLSYQLLPLTLTLNTYFTANLPANTESFLQDIEFKDGFAYLVAKYYANNVYSNEILKFSFPSFTFVSATYNSLFISGLYAHENDIYVHIGDSNGTLPSYLMYKMNLDSLSNYSSGGYLQFGGVVSRLIFKEGKVYVAGNFQTMAGVDRVGNACVNLSDYSLDEFYIPYNGVANDMSFVIPGEDSYLVSSNDPVLGGYHYPTLMWLDLQSGIASGNVELEGMELDHMELSITGDTLFTDLKTPSTLNYLGLVNTSDLSFYTANLGVPIVSSIDFVGESVFVQFDWNTVDFMGELRTRIASFNYHDFSVDPVYLNIDGAISDFLVIGDSVVIAGDFNTVNGVSRRGLAMLSLSDFSVLPWDANIESLTAITNGLVIAEQLVYYNGAIIVGGFFGPDPSHTANTAIAAFDVHSGERLTEYYLSLVNDVCDIKQVEIHNQYLFVCGDFLHNLAIGQMDLVAIDLTTWQVKEWDSNGETNSYAIWDIDFYGDILIDGSATYGGTLNQWAGYAMSWDLGCGATVLESQDSLEHCLFGQTVVNCNWSAFAPENYQWEYRLNELEPWSADVSEIGNPIGNGNSFLLTANSELELRIGAINECTQSYSNVIHVVERETGFLDAFVSDSVVCVNEILVANAGPSALWSNGIVSNVPQVMESPGLFEFYAYEIESCAQSELFEVEVVNNPSFSAIVVDSLSCVSGTGTVYFIPEGGESPYTYYLGNTIINALYSNANGEQVFTIRDANYCTSALSPEVPYSSDCYGCLDPLSSNFNPTSVFSSDCIYVADGCMYDLNQDLQLDNQDFNIVIENFGCFNSCLGDLNLDGVVGAEDLAMMLMFFDSSCE